MAVKHTAIIIAALAASAFCAEARKVRLSNGDVKVEWTSGRDGWRLSEVSAGGVKAPLPKSGRTVLVSDSLPSADALDPKDYGGAEGFPEKEYRYVLPSWREATSAVALNRAGRAVEFNPQEVKQINDSTVSLRYSSPEFNLDEEWVLACDGDIRVTSTLTAGHDGYYSQASAPVCGAEESELEFALIPGVLHGHAINPDFSRAYAYGWGIPALPVLFRERSTSTLSSMLTTRNGLTIAVTAEPGTAAGPWGYDKRNTGVWRLGLSAMTRQGELSPTLYHPVLGQEGSDMKAGESRSFGYRYTLRKEGGSEGWWPVFKHVANDIYGFGKTLELRHNKRSLTDRLYAIHSYVVNDSTSRWHTVECEGTTIGAQEYLGGVYKAKKDALKNADYGAMWMLGALTGDTLITKRRLPYALNFKVKQQHAEGPMKGASRGQYYLSQGKEFVEEWGPYTEPIATTYYTLMDAGNIALFEPANDTLTALVRAAAERLLQWQKPTGEWAVAYSDATGEEAFGDLGDYRPTFYGLLVAWRLTGDERYLAGARRGADRLIADAVDTHRWLGVCGDTRFASDFATIQAAQALLELYDATGEERYRDAALRTARFYTTSVYTNPMASTEKRVVKGKELEDWQISQSGLSYEHGGIIGSTNLHGPILLASHAGMFVRLYGMTGEQLFLDMARAAAIGRDAFVDDATGVASYYWAAMNRGAGPYPHHAWWQMGWITDYLLAELELRSKGEVSFPAGFITPKVGPHRTYGFAAGKVMGESAELAMIDGGVSCDNPDVEVVLARGSENLYIMLLNDVGRARKARITTDAKVLGAAAEAAYERELEPYGLEILKIPYSK